MCKETALQSIVPLHQHTEYSKDGMGRHEDLIVRAKECDYNHIAITDHGTLSGLVSHESWCKQYGITPIMGIEGYLTIDDLKNPKAKIKANHITMLALNETGYRNLVHINNLAHERMINRGGVKFPLNLYKDYKDHTDGIVVLTGCPASLTFHDDYDVAAQYVETLVRLFGTDNVFAEVQFTLSDSIYYQRPMELASELGIECVITNDSHFANKGDHDIHMMCVAIRSRATSGSEYTYDSSQLWLKSPEEMWEDSVENIGEEDTTRFFTNTKLITDRVEEYTLKAEPEMPHVNEEQLQELKDLVLIKHEEYKEKNPDWAEIAEARLNTEWDVIDSFGYWDYFYIVNDIAYFARTDGRLATARGSAAGSYIIYLLDITTVDPLKYSLLFERFLNTARHDFPDIDLDVASSFRPQVVKYCYERWGLLQVNTSMTFGHKSLINDLGKELSISPDITAKLGNMDDSDEFFQEYCKENELFCLAYYAMLDQQKTVGTHAAAVAAIDIDGQPIPIEHWGNEPGIAFSESGVNKSLSYVGGVKFDILGIDALDKLYNMEKATGVIPPDDPDEQFAKDVFCSGNTTGIFQFDGSAGIRQLTIDVQPDGLDELATINSLFRPGALDAGSTELYTEFKIKPRKFHEDIDKILAPTSSAIVFQEQVMEVYAVITGEGLEGADLARRILSPKSPKVTQTPKWKKEVKQVKSNFFAKGKENGYSKKLLNSLWDELITHSRYSFNKSHSISYSDLARRQAWYKENYPIEFYLSTLNTLLTSGHAEQMQDYFWAIAEEGYSVEPPSVLHSTEIFEMQDGKMYIPLTVVKYFSDRNMEALMWLRRALNGDEAFPEDSINGDAYYEVVLERLKEQEITKLDGKALACLSKGHTWNKRVKTNLAMLGAYKGLEHSDLLYDPDDVARNPYIMQTEAMGLIVPNEWYLIRAKRAEKKGWVFGVVKKKINKVTKRGTPITVFTLSGNAQLRVTQSAKLDLPVGTPVVADVNDYGYIQRDKTTKRLLYRKLYPNK